MLLGVLALEQKQQTKGYSTGLEQQVMDQTLWDSIAHESNRI